MGMNVDCLLSGKSSVAEALARLPRALRAGGFCQCGRVTKVAFDPVDGIHVDAQYVGELGQVAAEEEQAERLTGQAMEYGDEHLQIYLRVAGPKEGYVNAFLRTSDWLFGSGHAADRDLLESRAGVESPDVDGIAYSPYPSKAQREACSNIDRRSAMMKSRQTTFLAAALLLSSLAFVPTVAAFPDTEAEATAQDQKGTKEKNDEKTKLVPSGFLGDYSDLEPHPDTRNVLVYQKGDGPLAAYRRFLIERPLIYFHPEARGVGVDPRDLEMLSKFLQAELKSALSEKDGYEIVDQPGEGVALMRVAITDVVPIDPKRNIGTKAAGTVLGVGFLVPRVDLGSASVEAEILDSESGERLVAVLASKKAKRFGGMIKGSKEWGDAKAAFKSWAKNLRKGLDRAREAREG